MKLWKQRLTIHPSSALFLVETLVSELFVPRASEDLSQFRVLALLSAGPFGPLAFSISALFCWSSCWRRDEGFLTWLIARVLIWSCWLTLSSRGMFTQGPAVSVCHPVTSHTCHEVPCVPAVWPWVRAITQTQPPLSLTKPPRAFKVKDNNFVLLVQMPFLFLLSYPCSHYNPRTDFCSISTVSGLMKFRFNLVWTAKKKKNRFKSDCYIMQL